MIVRHLIRLAAVAALALAAGCATGRMADGSAASRAAMEIQSVERAFAEDADRLGIVPAFRQRVGPDAILFLPDPTIINPMLETANWPGDLDWRPDFVAVSAAGDLAFTSGPSAWRVGDNVDLGHYFSVWKRQPNGEWRFLVDGTTAMATNLYDLPETAAIVVLPAGGSGASGDVAALEAALAAEPDYRAALQARLDAQARVMRAQAAPASGGEALSLIARDPSGVRSRMLDGGVADSGDLAYAYGELTWTEAGTPRRGYYNRIWRRDAAGRWRVLFDQMNVRPES